MLFSLSCSGLCLLHCKVVLVTSKYFSVVSQVVKSFSAECMNVLYRCVEVG